jgi:hypothetical protein
MSGRDAYSLRSAAASLSSRTHSVATRSSTLELPRHLGGILKDAENPPAVGDIPQPLRDRFADAVNEPIQPKKPMQKRKR